MESSRQELPPDGFAECAFLLMLARRFDADMISHKKTKTVFGAALLLER